MKYSEYMKCNEYKIKLNKKLFIFRDAVKFFLEKYKDLDIESIEKGHEYFKSYKIIEEIMGTIKTSDFELDRNNKIILSKSIIIVLAKKTFLAKNSKLTFQIIEYFKNKNIISKKSNSFAKIFKEYDANRLSGCFAQLDLSAYNSILDFRDRILNQILHPIDENERERYLFYYLEVFSIKKYPKDIYSNFLRSNIHDLDGTIALIFTLKHNDDFSQIMTLYFDKKLNEVMLQIFFNESYNLLDKLDHYFYKKYEHYLESLNVFLKESYEEVTGYSLDTYRPQQFKKLIKNQIELEFQFHHSPLELTIQTHSSYPKTNYLELERLFPTKITNSNFKQIELANLTKQQEHYALNPYEAEEMDIAKYVSINTDAYMEFRKFRNFDKVLNKNDFKNYMSKLDKFITKNKKDFQFPEMFDYITVLIQRSEFHEGSKDNLASSTIHNYICILFNTCFQVIIDNGIIDYFVEEIIDEKINSYTKQKTINKYCSIINLFLNPLGFSVGDKSKSSIVYARKSLIFKKELDEICKQLLDNDKNKYFHEPATKLQDFVIYQRFIFCTMMYYSGLRESELVSRQTRDVYVLSSGIFIDVGTNQAIRSFKTASARRRVEFVIDDPHYLELFLNYLDYLETNKIKYFFPKITPSKKILPNEAQSIDYFLSCNSIIQDVTKRYASLHSFRHTFVTKNVRKLLMQEKKEKKIFLILSI